MIGADPAVRALLRAATIAEVGTRTPSGRPFVTPLYFIAHAGLLYITTGVDSVSGTHIAVHPRVTLLLRGVPPKGGLEPLLHVRGEAACVNAPLPLPVLLRTIAKYYVGPWGRALWSNLAHARQWGVRRRYRAQSTVGSGYLLVRPTAVSVQYAPTASVVRS